VPLYEYQCPACGHRFETIQKFSDPPLKECPKCGGLIEKLQSAPAFQFKGSGWYITDYARKDAASPDAAKSESKSDAKSADKGDKAGGAGKAGEAEATKKTESKGDAAAASDKAT
jgi:putative FmdB family regulatory protein